MHPSFTRRLLTEPLLHFVVIGALLFGVDHVVSSRLSDPRVIVLGPDVDLEASRLFREAKGREPSAGDLKALRERWIDNEVLYREGMRLRVDQGDSTIRERVIFKALNVVQANLVDPKIDEKALRQWFDLHRAKYSEPARLDFLEAIVARDDAGSPATGDAVSRFVTTLNRGVSGETQGGLRVFKGRPRDSVVTGFGREFTAALERLPLGTWHALPSQDGVRVVRLEASKVSEPVAFEAVRGEVLQDWKDERLTEQRTQAVRDAGKRYTVKVVAAP